MCIVRAEQRGDWRGLLQAFDLRTPWATLERFGAEIDRDVMYEISTVR